LSLSIRAPERLKACSLAVAVVASQAFSDFLTRNALGIATLWPSNALLAGGLLVLNPRRRIILTVAMVFTWSSTCWSATTWAAPLLYTCVDVGEALLVWWVTKRFFGGRRACGPCGSWPC
jgi:integral membrane sensor domain MASE1